MNSIDWIPDSEFIISKINETEDEINTTHQFDWIEEMIIWLKKDDQKLTIHQTKLLKDLSLDLPSYLIKFVYNQLRNQSIDSKNLPKISEDHQFLVKFCLNSLAQDGNPKEVFLSLTTIIPQIFSTSSNAPQNSSSPDHSSLIQNHFEFLQFLLPPLSIVTNKILFKSQNPTIFLNQFSQTLICIFDSLQRGRGDQKNLDKDFTLEQLVEIYRHIITACWTARSMDDYLTGKICTILAVMARLLFSYSSTEFPLGKAYLCHREPKWRSSFSRLMSKESKLKKSRNIIFNNDKVDPVKCIQRVILPIIDSFANCLHLKDKIIQLAGQLGNKPNGSCLDLDGLSYGALSGQAIVDLMQHGSLLINALESFLHIPTDQDEKSHQSPNEYPTKTLVRIELVERALSSSSPFLDTWLFLILSDHLETGSSEGDKENLAFKLLHLAANDPIESNRLLIFRSFASFVQHHHQDSQLKFLIDLINRHDLIKDQLNIKISLVHLIRETLSKSHIHSPGNFSNSKREMDSIDYDQGAFPVKLMQQLVVNLIDPTVYEIASIDHHLNQNDSNHSSNSSTDPFIDDLLKLNVEKLNLVFLLIKLDHENLVGTKNRGFLNPIIKERLITPIHQWIQNNYKNDRKLENLAVCSIELALDLCIRSID